MKKIGYQGAHGCYSEAAILLNIKDVEPLGFKTFEEIFENVKNDEIEYGFIPIENSTTGSVLVNYDLLLKHDVKIIKEVYFKIEHCLISHKDSRFENIKKVFSHPQAIGQCREFINKNNLKPVVEFDTAGSVKIVKDNNKEDEAAIAGAFSAKIYDMKVLKKNIQENEFNITRFFVISKKDSDQKKEKTSVVFKTGHYPGALVNCLQRFSMQDVNLTKLESRPIIGKPWEYVFYTDITGGEDDPNVKTALEEIKEISKFLKILGSYPKAKKDY
ncbi:prephenate dehydratase [Candidatus Woesearchaeota archaeon]|nr:prephenate dehydratase [Candidatus Woesearchaeota archaeon]